MSMFNYTTLHDIKDTCMIYEGNWPVKIWNFTDQRYEHVEFLWFNDHDGHKQATFRTSKVPTRFDELEGWRRFIYAMKDTNHDDSEYAFEYAEVVVKDERTGQPMHITFTGSTNRPDDRREVNYSIHYIDEEFHKWKRDLYWFWFNFKYNFKKFFKI